MPLIIAAAVLMTLTACQDTALTPSPTVSAEASPSATAVSGSLADQLFTVRYSADHTLNPITGTDPNNMALVPLMYEGLFVLNAKLAAEKVLCQDYSTPDGITYTITLKSGIVMSDGSTLTATDVKYTLNMAKQDGRFTGRLKLIDSVSAVDTQTVKITLKYANFELAKLLDVPIIKANSIDQNHPAGTGPYVYQSSGVPRLVAISDYRDPLPITTIYLKDCTDSALSVDFSSQAVDFFWDDPSDASPINILSDHEVRFYDTTILEYVGFNAGNKILSNPDLRRALGLAVDREEIIDEVYLNHAVAAPLVLSPNFNLYDPAWEPKVTDRLGELSAIFQTIGPKGLDDSDGNGYLEIQNAGGNWTPFSLTFIVNKDNAYRVEAARDIADSMKEVGIDVNLLQLSWNDYTKALQDGNFDMYYGDVSLPADYDLTELLSSSGSLDYGNVGNSSYISYIHNYLASPDDDAEKAAAKELCGYIYQNAPIIPVLYRQYAVHSNRNIVMGLNPTQSSLFYGFTDWKINLS
jgi:peptide/nickel transport system substrate-binding protein